MTFAAEPRYVAPECALALAAAVPPSPLSLEEFVERMEAAGWVEVGDDVWLHEGGDA